jgi:hypothetical protein
MSELQFVKWSVKNIPELKLENLTIIQDTHELDLSRLKNGS